MKINATARGRLVDDDVPDGTFGGAMWTASCGSQGFRRIGGRPAIWQRYEEATVCQRRPADPTDPGDAADLSIMG